MNPNIDKRHTRIDLGAVRGLTRFAQTAAPDPQAKQKTVFGNLSTLNRGGGGVTVTKRSRPATTDVPDALSSRAEAYHVVRSESPWESYEKIYELRVGDGDLRVIVADQKDPLSQTVTSAERTGPAYNVVMVRCFSANNADKKLRMLQRIKNKHFVSIRQVFHFEGSYHVAFEHMPISLSHFAGILKYPNELQLASILGQILHGLAYLANEGLEHGSLSSSNILVNADGDVKLANQEYCHARPLANTEPRDIRALGGIMMELMEKRLRDGEKVGVDNLHHWPSDSKALAFLSEVPSASSVDELKKHSLFDLPWGKERLQGLVDFVLVGAFRGYKYPPT